MVVKRLAVVFLILALSSMSLGMQQIQDSDYLGKQVSRLMQQTIASRPANSVEAYKEFVRRVTHELQLLGKHEIAEHVAAVQPEPRPSDDQAIASQACLIRTFAREFYQDEIIAATSDLIRFRTYANGVPNRHNPEFIKQKKYLEALASRLGLGFRDVDGYVQEIWAGDGERTFGIMVHSDVQPVDTSAWSVDPWGGELKSGALWGRGAIDDKGPLAAIMYGMRAVLDSGIPLKRKLVLLVGTDEESANEDVITYLKTTPPPDKTIVVDYSYPVICAEKGWCGVWLKLPKEGAEAVAATNSPVIESLNAGFSPSIVPGTASATLRVDGKHHRRDFEAHLRKALAEFKQVRPASLINLSKTDSGFSLTATGRSVHSSVPSTGHNALMDLIVFLDRHVESAPNGISLMVKFAARFIGLELDGHSLGISHHDDFMGDVTVAGNMFATEADSVMFMFNFRIPRGITLETLRRAIALRKKSFETQYHVRFAEVNYYSQPLYNDPSGPFVSRLLRIYNEVTGEKQVAESMGGGTYAKRIPNSIVFGPKLIGEEYLGHQPDERISLTTLRRNIEILTHTLADFAFGDD